MVTPELLRQWRIDALFWAYLGLDSDLGLERSQYARARAYMATELLKLGAIP